jgi:[ribosomal protein S5]-alanine N-acetyltransferase
MDTAVFTERLELRRLDLCHTRLWISDAAALDAELRCTGMEALLDAAFLEIVKKQADIAQKDIGHEHWYNFWILIRKCDRVAVGSADFKRPPDVLGEVEIGYGLGADYEHHGYMTEAVGEMCRWALLQNGVAGVTAETLRDNIASQRILQRCGFTLYMQEDTLWWRLTK